MPYYIYTITSIDPAIRKKAALVNEFEKFKSAKNEVRRLRSESPLDEGQTYRIIFAEDQPEAEQKVTEIREEPIAKEWEK